MIRFNARIGGTIVAMTALLLSLGQAAAYDVQTQSKPTEDGRSWSLLKADGVHDPAGQGVQLKQEPAEALSKLPADPGVGNQVRWVRALDEGYINPRTNILPETKVNVLDLDIILNKKGGMPMVRFPHRVHTLWLDCANCHEHLFSYKAGGIPISMFNILQGEQCGLCHGAVAFPLTMCDRCHSVPRPKPQATPAPPPPAASAASPR